MSTSSSQQWALYMASELYCTYDQPQQGLEAMWHCSDAQEQENQFVSRGMTQLKKHGMFEQDGWVLLNETWYRGFDRSAHEHPAEHSFLSLFTIYDPKTKTPLGFDVYALNSRYFIGTVSIPAIMIAAADITSNMKPQRDPTLEHRVADKPESPAEPDLSKVREPTEEEEAEERVVELNETVIQRAIQLSTDDIEDRVAHRIAHTHDKIRNLVDRGELNMTDYLVITAATSAAYGI